MNKRATFLGATFLVGAGVGLSACGNPSGVQVRPNPIVGTWLVKDPNAPFPYHLYVFNSDGTMQQANPDAGDAHASDSDGKGVWIADRDRIKGKWVELIADRATHQFAGRLEISYDIMVSGDTYVGTEVVRSYDASGSAVAGPATPAEIEGRRVTLP